MGPNDSREAARLHAIVDRLCALADMPKPRIAIAPTQMPNAFATGRNSKVAVLCATQGILQEGRLDNDELEGVLAHEMSHVAHKDVAVMTVASFLGIIAALMVRFAFYSELFGGRGRNNSQSALLIIPIMLLSIVVYCVSFLLIRMLSRYRELAADRSGALLTGRPHALASALVKVTGDMARIPMRDLRAGGAAEHVLLHSGASARPERSIHGLLHAPVAGASAQASSTRSPSSSASEICRSRGR